MIEKNLEKIEKFREIIIKINEKNNLRIKKIKVNSINLDSNNKILINDGEFDLEFNRFNIHFADYSINSIKDYFLNGKSELNTGRVMLGVCSQCGDIGCGATTFEIEIKKNKIIWKNFIHEVDYYDDNEEEMFNPLNRDYLLEFNKKEYKLFFEKLIEKLQKFSKSQRKDFENNIKKKEIEEKKLESRKKNMVKELLSNRIYILIIILLSIKTGLYFNFVWGIALFLILIFPKIYFQYQKNK